MPSATDLAEASYPDYLYVIVSLHPGTANAIEPGVMGAFWLRDGSATAVELRVD